MLLFSFFLTQLRLYPVHLFAIHLLTDFSNLRIGSVDLIIERHRMMVNCLFLLELYFYLVPLKENKKNHYSLRLTLLNSKEKISKFSLLRLFCVLVLKPYNVKIRSKAKHHY